MIDKIKQNLDILKKAYKLKKLVKNSLFNLYLYTVLKPPYVKLELTDGSKLIIDYLNYKEILDNYYFGKKDRNRSSYGIIKRGITKTSRRKEKA